MNELRLSVRDYRQVGWSQHKKEKKEKKLFTIRLKLSRKTNVSECLLLSDVIDTGDAFIPWTSVVAFIVHTNSQAGNKSLPANRKMKNFN